MDNQSNACDDWRWRKYMWLAIHDGAIILGVSLYKEMTKHISVRDRTLQLEHTAEPLVILTARFFLFCSPRAWNATIRYLLPPQLSLSIENIAYVWLVILTSEWCHIRIQLLVLDWRSKNTLCTKFEQDQAYILPNMQNSSLSHSATHS